MLRAFSAATREANLDRLGDRTYDVLVIGGGITGAGIALDAAARGCWSGWWSATCSGGVTPPAAASTAARVRS